MDRRQLDALLHAVREGELSVEQAGERLRLGIDVADLGFARIDRGRAARRGFPEAVYAPGKSVDQILAIIDSLVEAGQPALVTRVEPTLAGKLLTARPEARHHPAARLVVWHEAEAQPRLGGPAARGPVAIISAGTIDIPVAEEAAVTAEVAGCDVERIFDIGVAGPQRFLEQLPRLRRADVVVAVAGMDGALPTVAAGYLDCPLIAVPTAHGYGVGAGGVAALQTMLNACSPGVAVMNIDNGFGAGYFAAMLWRRVGGTATETP